jgi:hypothetical protein
MTKRFFTPMFTGLVAGYLASQVYTDFASFMIFFGVYSVGYFLAMALDGYLYGTGTD